MKNSKIIAGIGTVVTAVMLVLGVTSCDKGLDILKVNVPMKFSEVTFTIPISPIAGEYADEKTVSTNLDSLLAANKVNKDKIKSIKLKSLVVTVLDGDADNNFRLLESIKGQISKDGGSFVDVGGITGNPDTESYELTIPVNTQTEYKDYLSGSTFTFKVSGLTRSPVTKAMVVKAKLEFDLEATL